MCQVISRLWTEFRRTVLVLLLVVGVGSALLTPGSAAAANPSDEGCNQDDECRTHFVNGKSLYKQQDYTGALKEFQVAYERRQTPILLINIGRTLQKLGRPKEALDYYLRCREAAKTDTELQGKLDVYIAETRALVASGPTEPQSPPAESDAEPVPAPLTAPLTPIEKPKPIYKKWWFWTIIGVAVAGGVTTAAVLATRPGPLPPDPPLDADVTVLRPMFLIAR
jgi:hypothetical protein